MAYLPAIASVDLAGGFSLPVTSFSDLSLSDEFDKVVHRGWENLTRDRDNHAKASKALHIARQLHRIAQREIL